MSEETRPAKIYTVHGTVFYVDEKTGELRHGPIGAVPENVYLISTTVIEGDVVSARLIMRGLAGAQNVVCTASGCGVNSELTLMGGETTVFELAFQERGLFGLRANGLYLCSEVDGSVTLSREVCSIWECFLASEGWCAPATPRTVPARTHRLIREFLIDPRLRVATASIAPNLKILAYGYPRWSHGRVYYDLAKQLYRHGYIIDILNWQENHAAYIHEIIPYYDLVMTAPDGVSTLIDAYHVPLERMVVVSHHEFDTRMLGDQKGYEIFDSFGGYGVVSDVIYNTSVMRGIRRCPKVVPLGIEYDNFYMDVPEKLEEVGYASSMAVTTYGVEWKRGRLAEAACNEAGLPFKVAGNTVDQISFHDMPEFYRSVSAILMSSVSEAAPIPVMEAAAAGRLVIGTPVGHFPLRAYQGGGILAPIEAESFVAFTAKTLKYYRENTSEFVDKCHSIQESARQFDWGHMISSWVNLFQGARYASSKVG